MIFNKHYSQDGKHAFLSASKYHWVNYDDDKLVESLRTALAAQRGTELHEFAADAIRLGIKLQESDATLNRYVNDAIGFRMTPEQVLLYSDNAFGTADAISFRGNLLRIHDLKTGVTKASFTQLEVYAAFFCLEYRYKPPTIDMELRIYQNDEVHIHVPDPLDIINIMSKIVKFDTLIQTIKLEEH